MVSSKARVQRKAQANAPAHKKRKMLSAHLSKDL
ncbi:MAG: 60S ribosomal protein L26, partial [Candidatus Methanomethylophilus sp.]|nr:60S ribosomal protein L26 [Methanomethylophilus sp.]